MIFKASQRGNGAELVVHLMKLDDNEHVLLHELRGFAGDTLSDAFKEAEIISKETRCRQYLFSLSLNPPEDAHVTVAEFEDTITRIEERLGLQDQPRAIVFHEKNGRLHAHAAWSRIDADTMTAVPMSFFKNKLTALSRDLYLEHGWSLQKGLETPGMRDPTNFSLAEWQQAKRQGIDPRWLKTTLQESWQRSDNQSSFERALQDRGLFLARGDKRGFVVLDHQGDVWSLPKLLDVKTKAVRERLGTGDTLKSVNEVKAVLSERMTPAIKRHVEESRAQFRRRSAVLGEKKAAMTGEHRKARADLQGRQAIEWEAETRQRALRLPRGLRGLWHRITGQYQEVRRANEQEAKATILRHADAREKLIDAQRSERAALQAEFKSLRQAQAKQLLELRGDIGRFLKFSKPSQDRSRGRAAGLGLSLER